MRRSTGIILGLFLTLYMVFALAEIYLYFEQNVKPTKYNGHLIFVSPQYGWCILTDKQIEAINQPPSGMPYLFNKKYWNVRENTDEYVICKKEK